MGKVTHTFTVLQQKVDSVFFDGPGITIKSATLFNQPVAFSIESKAFGSNLQNPWQMGPNRDHCV